MSDESLMFSINSWLSFFAKITPIDVDGNTYGTDIVIGVSDYSPGRV